MEFSCMEPHLNFYLCDNTTVENCRISWALTISHYHKLMDTTKKKKAKKVLLSINFLVYTIRVKKRAMPKVWFISLVFQTQFLFQYFFLCVCRHAEGEKIYSFCTIGVWLKIQKRGCYFEGSLKVHWNSSKTPLLH